MQPETHYAESGDVSIAYQVVGEGPFDVIVVPGALSHVELYAVNGDGSEETQLTNTPDRAEFSPGWSPDAQKIAFSVIPSGSDVQQIHTMNDNGTNDEQLTTEGSNGSPDWQALPISEDATRQ